MVDPPTGGCIFDITDTHISVKWDPVIGVDPVDGYAIVWFHTVEGVAQTEWWNQSKTYFKGRRDRGIPYKIEVRCCVGGVWSNYIEIYEICRAPPEISSITWSPKGTVHIIGSGALFRGVSGTGFRIVAIGPSTTPPLQVEEASIEVGGAAAKTYQRGESFVLDGKGYTILHINQDWECDTVTIAENDSPNQHPAIGEKVQFTAKIEWNDYGATATTRRVEWFYLKPASEHITKAYASDLSNWTHFAMDTMPSHTFTDAGDVDVLYIKVIARNKANKTCEFGTAYCGIGQFNLWGGKDGFEITVVNATGTDDLTIGYANKVPGTNAYLVDPYMLRWDNVTNQKYFGVRDTVGCAYSNPTPNMCGSYAMGVGRKYAIYRSTSQIAVVPGESVFELKRGRTPVTIDRTYQNFLEKTICGLLGLTGSECSAFVAELNDAAFVANYINILRTGKDTFGNERELTWFDHAALPFALAGTLIPVPVGGIISRGLGAASKLTDKIFTAATNTWVRNSLFKTPRKLLGDLEDRISFSTAIVQVGKAAAEDVVESLDAGDTVGAQRKLQGYLDALDLPDTHLPDYWSWTEFNHLMKTKIADMDTYVSYIKSMKSYVPRARAAERAAAKASPTADDLKVIADAARDADVMEMVGKDMRGALKTLDAVTNPVEKANKVKAIENIAKNMPAAFDDVAKASIYDVSGYLIKHGTIENVLGKSTCSANYVMTTRLFKELFDGVDEAALAATECNGLMAIAKEDPVAIAKAIEDYTTKTDKDRLLLSLGKSGTKGEEAAAWIAAAKKNFDLSDVHQRFGTTVYEVVNDPSQIPMHGPHGVYRTSAADAIDEAINSVPNYSDVRNMNKFIRETSSTVREHMIAGHYLMLEKLANAKDKRGIADIFRSAGVDVIESDIIANSLWSVAHRLDVMGDVVKRDDLTTLTDRMVEANVVRGSKMFQQMVDRIVKNGKITTDELKSFFDVVNHNPVEVALAMEKIPAGALSSFNNVLNTMGNKGKTIVSLMDMRNTIRAKFGAVGDDILNAWVRTTPVGLRLSRTPGDNFGSGLFKSLTVHNRLLRWAGKHWRALAIAMGITGAARFGLFALVFEWQPFHAALRRAGVMETRTADKYTSVMYASGEDMDNLDWNIDKMSVRESAYNTVGILCELVDYAGKNPIPASKLATMQETFNLYVGTSAGIVGNSLFVDIQKDLRQLLMKYNEQFLVCINAGKCTAGNECISGSMVYEERKVSSDKLSNAEAYQTIIDDAWGCLPGHVGLGTIKCTSNQTGFGIWLDGVAIDHSWGKTWYILNNVPVGPHTVKIEMGSNYSPPFCEKIVTVVESGTEIVDCQMTQIVECSPVASVIISFDPEIPAKGEPVAFSGFADSDDPIKTWNWDFGDGTPNKTGQAVTHTYQSDGIYEVKLTVTNDCGGSNAAARNVTVSEEESGTLRVEKPIDAVSGLECTFAWNAAIHVDGFTIGKDTPFSIPFGTNAFIGGYGGPCGDRDITIILDGYDTLTKQITIDNGDSKTWTPQMHRTGTTPTIPNTHDISFSVPIGSTVYVDGNLLGSTSVRRLSTILERLRE